MEIPTLYSTHTLSGQEKRITTRVRKYWDFLRNEKAFPAESEVKPADIADIWDNCFIVEANNSCRKEDYKYKYLGKNIIKAYGADLTGVKVYWMAAPEAIHLADKYERILALKRPYLDEGAISLSDAEIVKYRQILLPLGDDGVNITAILGGMSYKMEEHTPKTSLFSLFRRKK